MRFILGNPVVRTLIVFHGCQPQSLDPQLEVVKFESLRLLQPVPRLFEPAADDVGLGCKSKMDWTRTQPRHLIFCGGRTIELAELNQRVRQISMKEDIARIEFQRPK